MASFTVVECDHDFLATGVLAFMGLDPEYAMFTCSKCGVEIGRPLTDAEKEYIAEGRGPPVEEVA